MSTGEENSSVLDLCLLMVKRNVLGNCYTTMPIVTFSNLEITFEKGHCYHPAEWQNWFYKGNPCNEKENVNLLKQMIS